MKLKLTKSQERALVDKIARWQSERQTKGDPTCGDSLSVTLYSGEINDFRVIVGPSGLRFSPRSNFNYGIRIEKGEDVVYARSRFGNLYARVRDKFQVQELLGK